MFFVVYIINNSDTASEIEGAFAVLPYNWIKNIEAHIEKFLNEGMNSSQVHKCFWSPVRGASARLDYVPNFGLGFKSFPEEGNYLCRLIHANDNCVFFLIPTIFQAIFDSFYFSIVVNIILFLFLVQFNFLDNFRDGIKCMMRKRVPPAIYNSNRISELPIPCTDPNDDEEEIETNESAIRGFILRPKRTNAGGMARGNRFDLFDLLFFFFKFSCVHFFTLFPKNFVKGELAVQQPQRPSQRRFSINDIQIAVQNAVETVRLAPPAANAEANDAIETIAPLASSCLETITVEDLVEDESQNETQNESMIDIKLGLNFYLNFVFKIISNFLL